jgi:hypothetical protein
MASQKRRNLINLLALILLVPASFAFLWIPAARFEREQINIHVHPDHVVVDGIYLYRNPYPFPVVQGLSIPLPSDAQHPLPAELEAEELWPQRHSFPLRDLWGRARFSLRLAAGQAVCLRVHYYQQAPSGNARYILTTTRPWLRPLEEGEYWLVPEGVTLLGSNYPMRPMPDGIAMFHKTQFMPDQDWVFSWRPQ